MSNPVIDPATGDPTPPAAAPPAISKEDFDAMRNRLDAFERGYNQAPAPAPVQSGPSLDDQLSVIDQRISAIDAEIDKAVDDGKPISKLLQSRDKLIRESTRLEIRERDLNPALSAGMQTLDYLSGEVTRAQMPHYDIVKKDLDRHLSTLPPDQRMNPQVRQAAYKLAIGDNLDKILETQKEAILRSVAIDNPATPDGRNGRSGSRDGQYSKDIPDPKNVLPKEAMQALRIKGITVDQHYRTLGYEGWEDFYAKSGKDYFGEEN